MAKVRTSSARPALRSNEKDPSRYAGLGLIRIQFEVLPNLLGDLFLDILGGIAHGIRTFFNHFGRFFHSLFGSVF